jgi:uncharacterized protein (DUF1697 family)
MNKYIAFLRAINVGTGRQVKMDILRKLFEDSGYTNVKSYIQTGNIIFETAENDIQLLRDSIEPRLKETFGFDIPVIIRTDKELKTLLKNNPFKNFISKEKTALYTTLLENTPDSATVTKIEKLSNNTDVLKVIDKDIFWLAYKERGKSPITNTSLEKSLRMSATTRNINTMMQLAKML